MAVLATTTWNDGADDPVLCVHGVTGHKGRFAVLAPRLGERRVVAVDLRGHGRSTWEAPWTARDASRGSPRDGRRARRRVGDVDRPQLRRQARRRGAAKSQERVERAVLLDPAMHVDAATATARSEGLCGDVSFGSPDEAIDTRLGDGTLVSTPRETLVDEAAQHLEQGEDGRWRWRFSPPAVIAAWSEMASPAPAWPPCPTLVVLGERSWIPNRVPRMAHLTSVPVPGGHTVLWDDPEATGDAVARFLA